MDEISCLSGKIKVVGYQSIMPADRSQWLERFIEFPHWECPTCRKGTLLPITDKLVKIETGPSNAAHAHPEWEPEWIEKRFAGFLKCSLPTCAEIASISGTTNLQLHEIQDDEHGWVQDDRDLFKVRSIWPAPIPITYPERTPEPVEKAIATAASLIWVSAEAAGNHLRQAVELFLDDVGIIATDKNGKRLTTHRRIEKFEKKDKENGEILLATKWLGNSGSHPGGLTRDDVLDAFDMLEYVLENQYGTTKKELLAKVAAINANKGPVKKKNT